MDRVFLTGLTGLLGHNLVMDLIGNGYKVRALVRDRSRYKGQSHDNMEVIQVNEIKSLTEAMDGCEVIIHCSAETRQDICRYERYCSLNVDYTLELASAAIAAGAKRFIFISSANTVGYKKRGLGDENIDINYPYSKAFYPKSKYEAEVRLKELLDKIDIVIINPTFMLGELDTKPSSGQIFSMATGKPVIFYPPGGKNFVYVKDVSKGVVSAIKNGKNGERYLLCSENISLKDFFKMTNRILKRNPVYIKVPGWVLMVAGGFGEILRLTGINTSLSVANLRIISIKGYYSNSKSVDELGISYTPIETAIEKSLKYLGINLKI